MKEWLKVMALVTAGIMAGGLVRECQSPRQGTETGTVVTDTVTYVDTVRYLLPERKKEVALGQKVVFLPVFRPNGGSSGAEAPGRHQKMDRVEEIGDTGFGAEAPERRQKIEVDSVVAVEIPMTQREYEGEDYHVWVSGYEPRLDSLLVFPRREVVTIREPPNKPKRWGIGVFAGYGVTPHGLQPCAGISINYNLWNF